MRIEFAMSIIKTAFEMSIKSIETYEKIVDEDGSLNLERVMDLFDTENINVIGYLDCTDGEQSDEGVLAKDILQIDHNADIVNLIVYFENDTPYQQYFNYILTT